MPNILRIDDLADGNALTFDLRDLLALVLSEGGRLARYAFPMGEPTAITWEAGQEIAGRINVSNSAVSLAWPELVSLTNSHKECSDAPSRG